MKKTEKKPKIHRQKTFDLNLTKFELLHLRDLMSLLLPPDGQQTLSQSLAELEGRNLIESMLWAKLSSLCESAGLPTDSEAPDYIIAPITSPKLGVFHLNHNLVDESPNEEGIGFLPDEGSQEDDSEDDEEGDD
jgi:hypothetical protein